MRPRYRFLRLERDDELRKRILAKTGRRSLEGEQAYSAYGAALDAIARLVDLQRRIVEDEA